MIALRKLGLVFCLLALGGSLAGCKQKQNDDEAIRDAVRQHLTALGTLNLQAMDMDFTKIAVQNNQASVDVSFRPKTGAPAGAAMQISYELEKQDGAWKVMKKSASGGMIEHPNPNVNPHGQDATGAVHGNLPNFQEILGSNAAAPNGTTQSNNTVSTQSGNQP